jgi:hypothetical protein
MAKPVYSDLIKLVEMGIPIDVLENRLRPDMGQKQDSYGFSDYSEEGFLGKDESLLDVVSKDWEVVEKLGTSHKEISEALERAISLGSMPNPNYRIDNNIATAGFQHCPWMCRCKYEMGNGTILIYSPQDVTPDELASIQYAAMGLDPQEMANDPLTSSGYAKQLRRLPKTEDVRGKAAVVSELHPHLIGSHYFFEGTKSPYRADPGVIISALNLGR